MDKLQITRANTPGDRYVRIGKSIKTMGNTEMRFSISCFCALVFATTATAQPEEGYDTAVMVIFKNTDPSDIYESSDGSGELTYEYEEAETCTLKSTTHILLNLADGIVHTVSTDTIELKDADPDAITIGQTDAYGSYVEINTLFSAATVRRTNYSYETCTAYCTNGEIRKNSFQIQTDHPNEVAEAIKTIALTCEES